MCFQSLRFGTPASESPRILEKMWIPKTHLSEYLNAVLDLGVLTSSLVMLWYFEDAVLDTTT